MTHAPLPDDEIERLQALHRCGLLDTPAEDVFDDFTRLAAIICGTPISLISLVDAERQWFKAKIGLDATETPRDLAFCAHAILDPTKVMVVSDTEQDARFATNSFVTSAPNIRFYAGASLVTSAGYALGTLCVIDRVPRDLSPQQMEALSALSRQVITQIEMRLSLAERENVEKTLREREERLRVALQELEGRNWELVEARDVAVAAARLKSEFLANTSHEVRTPLNGIMGMTHLLLGTAIDERQRKWLQTIQSSANALLTILNDILDFSKIEAGKMTLETTDFSLRAVIEDCAAILTGKAQEKQLTLHCRLPAPGAHPEAEALCGDPGRLRQVLINLLGNAIKFTDGGGTITVGAELLTETAGQARWQVWVQDSGIGIPLEKQASIFESFTQADGSTTRKYGGTGLGLTICRQLVTLMGGQMGLRSEPGKGSTFFLEITLDKGTGEEHAQILSATGGAADRNTGSASGSETTPPPPDVHKCRESARLLLAEDNPINQMVITEMLATCGFRAENLVLTTSGRECLQALHNAPQNAAFDLILMDVQMPDMDGMETTKQVRAEEQETKTPPIPIIAMTAHCMAGDRERLLALGMDDYLAKPIDFQQLKDCLARWLPAPGETQREAPFSPDTAQTAPGEDVQRPLLDDRQLAAATGGNADLVQRLLAAFVTSAPKMLMRCTLALEMEDGPGLQHWAHTLTGSCSTLGAWTLTPLCQQLESLGKQDEFGFGQAEFFLKQLQTEWEKVRSVVQARLASSETLPDTVSEPNQARAA